MSTVQLATRIDSHIKKAIDALCHEYGYRISRFVQDALLDKLEELEDLRDIRKARKEPARPLAAVLKELKAHGKL